MYFLNCNTKKILFQYVFIIFGFKEPNFQTLIDLANLFDVSADYMLGLTEKRR